MIQLNNDEEEEKTLDMQNFKEIYQVKLIFGFFSLFRKGMQNR